MTTKSASFRNGWVDEIPVTTGIFRCGTYRKFLRQSPHSGTTASEAFKTALVYSLVKEGKIYFLSRLRRFGKSLLVSTLKNYFLGRKELFKGPAIDRMEKDWHTYPVCHVGFNGNIYLLMRLVSVYTVYTEKQQSEGRVDCIVETDDYIYIFEFKLDGTAADALRQIDEKGYARPDANARRKLYRIGVSFSSETGTVDAGGLGEHFIGHPRQDSL